MRTAGLVAVAVAALAADSTAYQREIAKWRAEREAKLKADDGWLTVVGLHWLHEGVNTLGSDPKADAPLPDSLPARVGTIALAKGKAHFKPASGIQLKEMDLKTDVTPQYDRLALGRVKFFVIERESRFGVRVKDNDSEARMKFEKISGGKLASYVSEDTYVTLDGQRKPVALFDWFGHG